MDPVVPRDLISAAAISPRDLIEVTMEPPLCRTCNKRHWSRLCYEPRNDVTKIATPPVAKPVTSGSHVAPSVTRDYEAEIEALQAEVAMLKRALAEASGGKPKPMTAAERMKKSRERRAEITRAVLKTTTN